jgi:hypothetical protein
MISEQYVALGYAQIAVGSTADALTVPAGATMALFKTETAGVRWRDDGTAPTAAVGFPIADTDPAFAYSGSLSAIQFIAQSGSPVLNVAFYRSAG